MIKSLFLVLLLLQTALFAKSGFMKMCEHPTASQLRTLNAFSDSPPNDPISKERCKQINEGILEGSITSIHLLHKKISDLSPLSYLKDLKHIDINDNNITDLSPLAKLTKLKKLDITGNPISDISVLKNFKLTKLRIFSNIPKPGYSPGSRGSVIGVKVDLTPLSNMTTLEDLRVYGSGESVPNLTKLVHLTSLSLFGLNMKNLCTIKNSTKIKDLSLGSNNNLSSLKCIENFKNLVTLDIFNCPITDLSPLQNLPKLKTITFEKMPVSDIRPLAKLKSLEDLTFFQTKIKYLSPLNASKSLLYITDENRFKLFTTHILTGGLQMWMETVTHRSLAHCSPIDITELREGISCFEKDGTLKPWWKRMLRQ